MHLNASLHRAADVRTATALAQTAERGLFDSVYVTDQPALRDLAGGGAHPAPGGLDPLTPLAAVAGATSRVGLIAAASTTFHEPFNLARALASLDHISAGRAGWGLVASGGGSAEAANFNLDEPVDLAVRYERAAEFLDVASQLWDSWADDALPPDRAPDGGADPSRVREIDHTGLFFKVRGPLTVQRPPQGWPLLAHADGSEPGREFSARYAEVVFTVRHSLDDAVRFARDLKARAASYGRGAELPRILPRLRPGPGAAAQTADLMADWVAAGAADGFSIQASGPAELSAFVDEVVPILRRRGLVRTEYTGRTLREHYGLERPADFFPERVPARV